MNKDEICKANELFDEGSISKLSDFIEPFLKKDDSYALYFSSCFAEWDEFESLEVIDQKRLSLLTKAAESNVAPAMFQLSALYFTGDSVDINVQIGKSYLDRALEIGYGPAR